MDLKEVGCGGLDCLRIGSFGGAVVNTVMNLQVL
jgi:hypothetical protein